mmetsp:Transcript_14538/g.34568  ORF Transcript_14538/g.34568 Transcript_14538/m.34568 type:complete len:205 (+) Transcript_14538:2561-3175(+)
MAKVKPKGSKEAWLTQDTGVVTSLPSSKKLITACEVRILPKASSAPSPGLALTWATFRLSRFRRCSTSRHNFWKSRTPEALHRSSTSSVGRNLARTGSKASGKPESLSRNWSSSTASPLQPKDPKTPQGMCLSAGRFSTTPKASFTWEGISPPKVGLPIQKPSAVASARSTSSAPQCSRFMSTTLTPLCARPLEMLSAKVLVWP